jgi:hypothetical protein
MTTTEVARALGISYRRVHAWAARGYIDGLACNGRGPRFSGSPTTSPAFIADTLKSCANRLRIAGLDGYARGLWR